MAGMNVLIRVPSWSKTTARYGMTATSTASVNLAHSSRTTRAGLPTATTRSGRSLTTTAPDPTTTSSPIVTPGPTMTPPPSQTRLPIVIGNPSSRP